MLCHLTAIAGVRTILANKSQGVCTTLRALTQAQISKKLTIVLVKSTHNQYMSTNGHDTLLGAVMVGRNSTTLALDCASPISSAMRRGHGVGGLQQNGVGLVRVS